MIIRILSSSLLKFRPLSLFISLLSKSRNFRMKWQFFFLDVFLFLCCYFLFCILCFLGVHNFSRVLLLVGRKCSKTRGPQTHLSAVSDEKGREKRKKKKEKKKNIKKTAPTKENI